MPCLERGIPFRRLAHVVAGCWAPVLRPWRPPGAGLAGFRRTGQAGQGLVDVPEPAADPGRGQPPGRAGRSQGRRRSAASGRASRSWAWQAMTIQVHRSAAAGSRSFGAVQPRTCLNSRKVCSRSKPDCIHRRIEPRGSSCPRN